MPEERRWVVDRHISIAVIAGLFVQSICAVAWFSWWGSSYSAQLQVLTATVSELRVEQRGLQQQVATNGALSDKRLSLLEQAIPEIKAAQRDIADDLRELNGQISELVRHIKGAQH